MTDRDRERELELSMVGFIWILLGKPKSIDPNSIMYCRYQKLQ